MRLGLHIGYSAAAGQVVGLVEHAERVGVDSVWAGEAYGADAVTVLAYLAARTERIGLGAAVWQMPARTPAATAMTAMSLDGLSGGRMLLGLGLSGPQVVEGWHGVAYGRPLTRTREYVDIVRRVINRDGPLTYDGEAYQIPYHGPDATGLGKALKSILHPVRASIPIYLAAVGPRNTRLAGEIADGWLPIFYSPEREEVLVEHLDAGLAAAGRETEDVDIAATVQVAAGEDLDACRDRLRPRLALYVGGMGSRRRNFYKDLMVRLGFEEAAERIQSLYLDGSKAQAAAAVPDQLVDELALTGPVERITERVQAWKASRVDTLVLATDQPEVLEPIRDALG